jgi:endonuclease/exonuclease/phosphatase family metal-dependent hydrolase
MNVPGAAQEDAPMRVVVWNLEWAPRARREGIRARIAELAPDILCAPEADRDVLPADGHVAEGGADWGYGIRSRRRKALLWSRWPLEDVDAFGSPGLPPGRYVAATVRAPGGPVRLVAVCIPWRDAHVRTGRRDRRPWDEHLQYLHALAGLVRTRDRATPTVLLGDLNQRIPRSRAPRHVHAALVDALGDLAVATAGALPGLGGRQAIDHVAHCGLLRARAVEAIDCTTRPERLSDHDAVVAELAPATAPGAGAAGAGGGGSRRGR